MVRAYALVVAAVVLPLLAPGASQGAMTQRELVASPPRSLDEAAKVFGFLVRDKPLVSVPDGSVDIYTTAPLGGLTSSGAVNRLAVPGVLAASGLTRRYIDTNNNSLPAANENDWAALRSYQSHYMVGLGKDGWGFDSVDAMHTSLTSYGYVGGSAATPSLFQGCARMYNLTIGAATGGSATFDCSPYPEMLPAQFMARYNGNIPPGQPGANCTETLKCDGSPISIKADSCPLGVPVYSNVKPWVSGSPASAAMYVVPPTDTRLRWRYLTKDWLNIAVRWNAPASDRGGMDQDWGFVPSTCLDLGNVPTYAPPAI